MSLKDHSFSSVLPTNVIFGVNSLEIQLPVKIKERNIRKVFIATDNGLVKAGVVTKISNLLKENEIESVVFSDVEPNPHAETIMKGADVYRNETCEMILAIGGGSPMDFAKSVGVVVSHDSDILEFATGKKYVTKEIPLLFTIPTTVGTGSEVTAVAVVTDHTVGRKFTYASPLVLPKVAFLDPLLTQALPRHHVSATSMDALVHSIEAYVSIRENPIADGLALQAIRMISKYLPASYANPNDLEARSQIQVASTIAGMSFGLVGVGIVHSCSHPMSAVYNVPHGLANAIILPHVIEYNLIANYGKYADIARIFEPALVLESNEFAAKQLVEIINNFSENIDIPKDFSFLNIDVTEEVIERLSHDAMNDRGTVLTNPRKVFKEDIEKIYRKVLPQK